MTDSLEVARKVFCSLNEQGIASVILHHFDFEDGGDIDFCSNAQSLDDLYRHLHDILKRESWEILQILEHEQSAAYLICAGGDGETQFLMLDACLDYRIQGHLVLPKADLLRGNRRLDWGGFASEASIELTYRFVKAAAKSKPPAPMMDELAELWATEGDTLKAWLQTRWGIHLRGWSEDEVAKCFCEIRRALVKRQWSPAEIALKVRRVLTPRGLWIEWRGEQPTTIQSELGPAFRKIHRSACSMFKVFGSDLIFTRREQTGLFRRLFLKSIGCWLEASSTEDVMKFLVTRTARYHGWKKHGE